MRLCISHSAKTSNAGSRIPLCFQKGCGDKSNLYLDVAHQQFTTQSNPIQSLAAGAAGSMPNISKANVKTVRLPIPPLHLQNQFATIVEKVEGIKTRYQQSLTDLESLYGALSQKAFKGELDLSRIQLEKTI